MRVLATKKLKGQTPIFPHFPPVEAETTHFLARTAIVGKSVAHCNFVMGSSNGLQFRLFGHRTGKT
jgi:hypothetical protein